MPQLFLPRGTFPTDYGERLRAAGLNEGAAWGGSEVTVPEGLTPQQQAQYLALASGGVGPVITNQDLVRFAGQKGLGLPGLEGVGGEGAPAGSPGATPSGENPATMDVATTGGRGAIASAIDSVVNAANSSTAKDLGVALQAGSIIPGVGSIPATIATGINAVGRLGSLLGFGGAPRAEAQPVVDPTLVSLNPNATPTPDFTPHDLAVAGSLGITDPSTQGFRDSTSRTGYRDISGKELADPNAPALPACFLAGTLVKTVDGYTPIEEIEPGTRVPTSKGISRIDRVYKGRERDSYRINGIAATGYHPFARPDGKWTAARELKVGDEVCGFDGNVVIEQHEYVPAAAVVWNLLVEPDHEFYVAGRGGDCLVHNGDGVRRDDAPPRAYGWATIVKRGHEYLIDPRTHRSVELTGAHLGRQKKSGLPLVTDPRGRRMRLDDGGDGEGEGGEGTGTGTGPGDAGFGPGETGAGFGPGEATEGDPGLTGDPGGFGPTGFGPGPADEPEGGRGFAPAQVTAKAGSQGGSVGDAWSHAKRFAGGGSVPTPTTLYSRGGSAVPPMSERQARLHRIRAFEQANSNRPI